MSNRDVISSPAARDSVRAETRFAREKPRLESRPAIRRPAPPDVFPPDFVCPRAALRAELRCEMSAQPVIETQALSKVFGNQKALDGVSLAVAPGAIGLLGPNGAGKTHLHEVPAPASAHHLRLGQIAGARGRPEGREIRKRVGYTPEQDCHIPGMAGCEYVTYCAQLCGLPFQAARQRAHEMLDFVGMGQERYRKVDTYSTGMKQRLKLAQAIVHDPEIVFLDEPTNGLDPKGQAQILELVQSLWRTYGITVVLSSHLLHDVEQICEQIIIIARGRVLVHDTPGESEGAQARRGGGGGGRAARGFAGGLRAAAMALRIAAQRPPQGRAQADSLNPLLQPAARV